MFDVGEYTVHFKHNRTKTKNGLVPRSTVCFITKGEEVLGSGSSKPVTEIPVKLGRNQDASALYGKHLKKVHRFDDGTKVAVVSGDKFKYSTGRKEALKKALADAGFSAKQRKKVWQKYRKVCK